MALNLKTQQAETREQWLGTITQWEGRASQLARDSAFTYGCSKGCDNGGRRLCEASTPFSQASMCAEHIAVTNATIIQDYAESFGNACADVWWNLKQKQT